MPKQQILPLAISMGEPAGIGSDLILRIFAKRQEYSLPSFIVYGNVSFLKSRAKKLGLDINITRSEPKTAIRDFANSLPVMDIKGECQDRPGVLQPHTGAITIKAIKNAVNDIKDGVCSALVTAPIHKAALYEAGFNYAGHTEFLASLYTNENGKSPTPIMMLAHKNYRAIPLTIHVPICEVPELVTFKKIVDTVLIVNNDLQGRFNISKPKLAIAGLNPHAGEDATIGLEDRDIIAPAISHLQKLGINAIGPLAADTLFHPPHWASYDCVIAMYHDQALIPIKTLAFDEGVNITLGLPIIRTSPDHGTALGLAGSNKASPNSMLAAIKMADEMSKP